MADKIVMVDTFHTYRPFKTDKANSKLVSLVQQDYKYCSSAITEYEIYTGAGASQLSFWQTLLNKIEVLPFDKTVVKTAIELNIDLKRKRKLIDLADLFITATAISNNLPFATLNIKHFGRIDQLEII